MAAFFIQSTSQLWILAAFKINQRYIAANLCINRFEDIPVCKGSCYLEEQLNKNQEQQQKLPDLKNKEITLFCQDIQHTSTALAKQTCDAVIHSAPGSGFVSSGHLHSVFRPPSAQI